MKWAAFFVGAAWTCFILPWAVLAYLDEVSQEGQAAKRRWLSEAPRNRRRHLLAKWLAVSPQFTFKD